MHVPRPATARARTLLLAVIAAAVTFAVFHAACGTHFVNLDDPENFEKNAGFQGVGAEQLRWCWTATLLGVYQPVAWMLAGAEFAASDGLNPRTFHTVNVVLHALSAAMVFLLVRRLLAFARPGDVERHSWAADLAALSAAICFACHPLRVETVAWASAQPYALMVFFSLAATLVYVFAHSAGLSRTRRFVRLTIAWGLCALAMLSKAPAMTLPIVFLLIDAYPLRRFADRTRRIGELAGALLEKLPFLALSIGAGVAAIIASRSDEAAASLQTPGIAMQLAEAVVALGITLKNTLLPIGLTPHVDRLEDWSNIAAPVAASVIAMLALTIAAVVFAVRRRYALLVAWVAFLVISLPSLGVVRHGIQLTADRYTYLASVPWAALLGGGLFIVFRSASRVSLRIPTAIALPTALIALMALAHRQTNVWSSSERLWRHAIACNERDSVAHRGLGSALLEQDRDAEALKHYRRAAALNPADVESLANIGALCMAAGRLDDAETAFGAILETDPTHADALNSLGVILKSKGRLDAAEALYQRAIAAHPDYPPAYNNLGNLLYKRGDYASAEDTYRQAIRLDPNYAEAWNGLGLALIQRGRRTEAASCFERVLSLQPDHADAAANLSRARRLDAQ